MKKTQSKQQVRSQKSPKAAKELFGFTRRNYLLFLAGLGVIILGYFALAQPPVNGFMTLSLAPVLLIIGYCVLVPWAIFHRSKAEKSDS